MKTRKCRRRLRRTLVCMVLPPALVACTWALLEFEAAAAASAYGQHDAPTASCAHEGGGRSRLSLRVPGRPYEMDSQEEFRSTDQSPRRKSAWVGTGREFDLFDTRGGQSGSSGVGTIGSSSTSTTAGASTGASHMMPEASTAAKPFPSPSETWDRDAFKNSYGSAAGSADQSFYYPSAGNRRSSTAYGRNGHRRSGGGASRRSSASSPVSSFFQPVADWWSNSISPNIKNWPKIQCRVEPTTTLKIRKTFRPLKTTVRLGADFNTQLGVWQFKSSWEDDIIGGKITLAGRELQLTKSWQLSVGAVEDLVTRLRFRAAVDLQTWKAYARVGFRTERLSPINVMEGFTVWKQVALDGTKGHVKMEVKANFALPEPEIEYSTESQRSLVGMGDIEVNIEELNLVFDY